ncbi:MAG: carbamoyltransferase HypF [Fervidicoccaceae archaeon]
MEEKKAKKITVTGVVQGVGFRPFVYRVANSLGLKGYVKNLGGSEVLIHVEGNEREIENLVEHIKRSPPSRAIIEKIIVKDTEMEGWSDFLILESDTKREVRSSIPPDIGICEDCLREVLDKASRFHMYPFHSCVNCGPRYSIMIKPPYDRENTSMKRFPLCEECRKEYEDPQNLRRFFAQGISCSTCGPKVYLLDSFGKVISSNDPILEAGKLLQEGYTVAVKGIGGYHIAVIATSSEAVERLRRRKKRGKKPFALMARDIAIVERNAYLNERERQAIASPQRPIVLLRKKSDSCIVPEVAPGLSTLGFMIPYTALHYLLLDSTQDKVAVMTSANISGEPTCTTLSCVLDNLGEAIDFILDHNRPIINRVDDSVIKFVEGKEMFLRRSRGYAPSWIEVKTHFPKPVISLGAFLNNTGAIAFENKVVLTPHIGDLDSYSSIKFLFSELNKLSSWYGLSRSKVAVVIDKHPLFPQNRLYKKILHTQYEEEITVQHHCAHAFQAIAEFEWDKISGSTAITIDGTGYGEDGEIWGGEVLTVGEYGCKRVASIRDFPLFGGDLAAVEATRPLAGILASYFTDGAEDLLGSLKLSDEDKKRVSLFLKIIDAKIERIPSSSSLGRLLDAVGCALGFGCHSDYDGEIPMMLEDLSYNGKEDNRVEISHIEERGLIKIDPRKALEIIPEIEKDEFSNYVYTLLLKIGEKFGDIAARKTKSDYVILSGGAAVNKFLLKGIKRILEENGKELIVPSVVPPGDGGISLGQAIYAGQVLNGYIKTKR